MAPQIRRSKAAALVVDQAKIRQRPRGGEYRTARQHERGLRRPDARRDEAPGRENTHKYQGQ
jgi:hypothetical protein